VKPLPIRLLALCITISGRTSIFLHWITPQLRLYCGAQSAD
jgi:hypothetical protein